VPIEEITAQFVAETGATNAACVPAESGVHMAVCYGTDDDGIVVGYHLANGQLSVFRVAADDLQSVGLADSTTASVVIEDGTWLVGTDIAPGTYRADGMVAGGSSADWCYWARLSDLTGGSEADDNGIIDNHLGTGPGQVLVEILPTDVAFETKDCGTWTLI
jgi:hypothetical protein